MALPFNPFTHVYTFTSKGLWIPEVHFSLEPLFSKIKDWGEKKEEKSREAAPGVRELGLAEQSKVEAAVVYCFKPSVPNNLCKQGHPIPAKGTIMPLLTEAVAPHCPHQ